ncbi:hypothetical protein DFJ73DRAFT_965047 [Zopfochytrium polystomum]|nr:hypothetical protein DFJ73DRAFT_965047 [Zopfochytrium polystomum]
MVHSHLRPRYGRIASTGLVCRNNTCVPHALNVGDPCGPAFGEPPHPLDPVCFDLNLTCIFGGGGESAPPGASFSFDFSHDSPTDSPSDRPEFDHPGPWDGKHGSQRDHPSDFGPVPTDIPPIPPPPGHRGPATGTREHPSGSDLPGSDFEPPFPGPTDLPPFPPGPDGPRGPGAGHHPQRPSDGGNFPPDFASDFPTPTDLPSGPGFDRPDPSRSSHSRPGSGWNRGSIVHPEPTAAPSGDWNGRDDGPRGGGGIAPPGGPRLGACHPLRDLGEVCGGSGRFPGVCAPGFECRFPPQRGLPGICHRSGEKPHARDGKGKR